MGLKFSTLASSFIASCALLISAQASATLTYTSSSGASQVDLTDPTKPIFYGGIIGGACTSSGSTSATCNSCAAFSGTGMAPCNINGVTPSTILSLTFSTTTPMGNSAPEVHVGSATGTVIGSQTATPGATSFTVQMAWSDICKTVTSGDTSCQATGNNTDLYILVPATSGGTSDTITVHVATSYADSATPYTYSDCFNEDNNTAGSVAFCHFKAFPGDSKIYADELTQSADFPTTAFTGIKFNAVVFFYEEQLPTDANDAATVARITTKSPMTTLGISLSGSSPISNNWIKSLTNGTRYCMIMASQDAAGVINGFTPTTDPTIMCTSPEPVVGLLDDKHCFIATAAFGSDMAPEVQSFRDFRNKFLLPFSWGQKFVKTYYKYSPKYATMISQNETARTVARGALWPLLFFARMSLVFGFWTTLLILSVAVLCFFELYRRLILGRKVRGEL